MAEWPANGVENWNTKNRAFIDVGHNGLTGSHNEAGLTAQVVNVQVGASNTGTTQLPSDNTVPQITEGDEYMTLAITPKSATNKLKIDIVCHVATSQSSETNVAVALFQDSTANALAVGSTASPSANLIRLIVFTHWMAAGTTSSTTFKVRAGGNAAGTTTFNGQTGSNKYGGVIASSITITEIWV